MSDFSLESLFPAAIASLPLSPQPSSLYDHQHNYKETSSDEEQDDAFLNEMILNPFGVVQAVLKKRRRIKRRQQLQEQRRCAAAEEESRRTRSRLEREFQVPDIPKKRRRTLPICWTDINGISWNVLPRQSWWFNAYLANPKLDSDVFHKRFRLRFRLPYAEFLELVELLEQNVAFGRWHDGKETVAKAKAAPLSLLVLTALRYLGRGWTFDDCAENTAISSEVIRNFFHVFIQYGATELYQRYVNAPACSAEASSHMHEYEAAGFPGAIGSTDATHIMIERVSHRFRQSHMGFKMSHTARTYNITVNHRRRILATTKGHPARWNDKTLILYDDFICGINEGEILNDVEFELYDYATPANSAGGDNNVVKVKYQGAWVLVDNGYLNWASTVPPIKSSNSRAEIRFSAWLESLRKDVECTFGILKGRWRVLKTGVRLAGVHSADSIFMTCCALHNWLLFVDGLDDRWEDGTPSDWEGELGEVRQDDLRSYDEEAELLVYNNEEERQHEMPDAIYRLNNPVARRGYGGLDNDDIMVPAATTGPTTTVAVLVQHEIDGAARQMRAERPRKVWELTLAAFRSKLITHFDIAYKQNEIVWPKRTRQPQPPDVALT